MVRFEPGETPLGALVVFSLDERGSLDIDHALTTAALITDLKEASTPPSREFAEIWAQVRDDHSIGLVDVPAELSRYPHTHMYSWAVDPRLLPQHCLDDSGVLLALWDPDEESLFQI